MTLGGELVILGAGGHARVIADIARALGREVVGYLDDNPATITVEQSLLLGSIADVEAFSTCRVIVAIGSNKTRRSIVLDHPDLVYDTLIHPSAVVSPSVTIGEGSVVMPHAVVNAGAAIGRHCIVNTGAVVEHDNRLADYVHVSPGAALGGTVAVGEGSHIGIGASVRNNVSICGGAVVGAGAVVVEDIESPGTYWGVPAKLHGGNTCN